MIVPDDVVKIIGEFSKPCFAHRNIYQDVLGKLSVREWPELKEKLSANEIVDVVKNYINAVDKNRAASLEPDFFVRWQLTNEIRDAENDLMIAVYGDRELPWDWWKPYSTWWPECKVGQ